MKSVSKIISGVCNGLIIVITIVLLVTAAGLLIPKAMGYEMFAVLSGSMEPFYHVGSIVYVDTSISADEIQVGDPISFKIDASTVATHRVVEIDKEQREFITKGDANEVVDVAPVSFGNLIGKATISIPYLGYVTLNIKSKQGMMVAICIVLALILLFLIPEILKPEDPKEKEAAAQKKAEKAAKKAAKKQ